MILKKCIGIKPHRQPHTLGVHVSNSTPLITILKYQTKDEGGLVVFLLLFLLSPSDSPQDDVEWLSSTNWVGSMSKVQQTLSHAFVEDNRGGFKLI